MVHQFPLRTRGSAIALFLVLALVASSVLAACGGGSSNAKVTPTSRATRAVIPLPTSSPTSVTIQGGLSFVVIADGPASDPFWSLVKRGADQAALDMHASVTYQAPAPYSVAAMSQFIDAAVATQPAGLVLSLSDCSGLTPAIKRAELIGIPIIAINSGSDCASKLGLLNYVGQSQYQAGLAAGQKLVADGAKHVLCVNDSVGNPALDDRCRGIKDALIEAGKKSDVLAINLSNPSDAQQKIQADLVRDPTVDSIITLNSSSVPLAMAAAQKSIHLGQIIQATFGLSSTVFQAIEQGEMLFAINQQPYLQGYLPIVLLTLYKMNLSTVTTPDLLTGPDFVTKSNVAQVQQSAVVGTY